MSRGRKKESVTCVGPYQPVPLEFLRSRACAELSPLAKALLLDILAQMGPNGFRNGDITLAPKVMAVRGWTSRTSLNAACNELRDARLIVQTRQGGRKDCSLWALTLYAINCDRKKLDVGGWSYERSDWMAGPVGRSKEPTAASPAVWNRPRKNSLACPVGEQHIGTSSHRGTKPDQRDTHVADFVQRRDKTPAFASGLRSPTGHLSEIAIRRWFLSPPGPPLVMRQPARPGPIADRLATQLN